MCEIIITIQQLNIQCVFLKDMMERLQTKLFIPENKRTRWVQRENLLCLADQWEEKKIMVVSAPAGFGKTTFLSQWIEKNRNKTRMAWLSIDKGDNAVDIFWNYVIGAIQTVLPKVGQSALDLLISSDKMPIENLLIHLINDFSEGSSPCVICLDDYHHITDQRIHDSIEFFIDHLPFHIKLIIISRRKPPLHLSRLRASGMLLEISEKDLRFSSQEVAFFMNDIHNTALSNQQIKALTHKTEGWGVALHLSLLSLGEQGNKASFLKSVSGGHRFILDYLVEEVLLSLPASVKEFMIQISFLDRFSEKLCMGVTENENAKEMLDYMEQHNLFLVSLDHERNYFRFHHLFGECLYKKLTEKGDARVRELKRRAFLFLKREGKGLEAFGYGIESGEIVAAAALLSRIAPVLMSEDGGILLMTCIKKIPDTVIESIPQLFCYSVWLRIFEGDFGKVPILEEKFKTHPDWRNDLTIQGFFYAARGYLAFYQNGDFESAIKDCTRAINVLPEVHDFIKGIIQFAVGVAYRYNGQQAEAFRVFSDIDVLNFNMNVIMCASQADFEVERGHLEKAYSISSECIENIKRRFGDEVPPMAGFLYFCMGNILREKNLLDEAFLYTRKGLNVSVESGFLELDILSRIEYARTVFTMGRYEEADRYITQAGKMALKSLSSWFYEMISAQHARFALMRDDLETVELWVKKSGLQQDKAPVFRKSIGYLTLVRYHIRRGRFNAAHILLNQMIQKDIPLKRNGRLLECLILKSVAYSSQGKTDSAMTTFKRAFLLTKDEGYVRLFLDEGSAIQELFKMAHQKKLLPDYLIPFMKSPLMKSGSKAEKSHKISLIINDFEESFNTREVEIISLMKKGQSNKEIAESLYLSVNTVRWYAGRIFLKLNVKRRGEAVAKAVEMGVI